MEDDIEDTNIAEMPSEQPKKYTTIWRNKWITELNYLRDFSHLSYKKPIISLNRGVRRFKIFSTSFLE